VLTAEGGTLRATIQTQEVASQHVVLPVGTSTVLDLNVPITRVEVAVPEVAELTVLSPRQILIAGVGIGTTQAILWDEQDNRLVFAVVVEPNLAQLRALIQDTAPGAQVDIRVVNEAIILTGRVPNTDTADRITKVAQIVSPKVENQMVVAGEQQVLLRCTVAEVSKSAVRRLGVDAWASFEDNSPRVTARQLSGVDPTLIVPTNGVPGLTGTAFFGNRFLFGSTPEGWGFTFSSQTMQMEMFLRAMQENSLLKVLAEPNLVALSGEKAAFLAGGEFPVPVPQATINGTTITIEWKAFGVKLEFVPTVIGQQRIRLTVAPEVSEIDFTTAVTSQGFVIPGVSQRRATTTIEMASGTTIAIAGLLSEQHRGTIEKLPGLGDLPVLGALFRSVEYQRDLTELVILVTPELVTAMYPDQIATLPGELDQTPSDFELYALGSIEGGTVMEQPTRNGALYTDPEPHYRKFNSPPERMSLHGPWGPAEAEETEVEEIAAP
jgi:pilus assembly protein CpaC